MAPSMIGKAPLARRIMLATAIAGALDMAAAIVMTAAHGGLIAGMLRFIASGPFPGARDWGLIGAAIGVAVHFFLIALMAAAFMLAADKAPALERRPLIWGTLYGILLWAVMNLLALPARFGVPPPQDRATIAIQLFCHILLVGIPIALVAQRA